MTKKIVKTKIVENCDACDYGIYYLPSASSEKGQPVMACCYPVSFEVPKFIMFTNTPKNIRIPEWCPLPDVNA